MASAQRLINGVDKEGLFFYFLLCATSYAQTLAVIKF